MKNFVTEHRCFFAVNLYIDIDIDEAISVVPGHSAAHRLNDYRHDKEKINTHYQN